MECFGVYFYSRVHVCVCCSGLFASHYTETHYLDGGMPITTSPSSRVRSQSHHSLPPCSEILPTTASQKHLASICHGFVMALR